MHTSTAVRVKQARSEANLTQEELARELGCALSTVTKWEQGTRTPRLRYLRALAEFSGHPISWFFSEKGEEVAA